MEKEFTETQSLSIIKNKVINFYNNNKLLIFSSFIILIVIFFTLSFYLHSQGKKKLMLTNLYVEAKIDIKNNKNLEAKNKLVKVLEEKDPTYSPLSLFLIIDKNLIKKDEEIVRLFDRVLTIKKLENEIKNLIIYKKAIIQSNFADESKIIETLNPIINSESVWRPHALLLLGDYFHSKGDLLKAKEQYQKILLLSNVDNLHDQAKYRLQVNANE